MDNVELEKIIRRKPHIPLPKVIRANTILDAFFETHPDQSQEQRMFVMERINAAIVLANSAHQGVLRKSGEPYIIHPYSVAYFLAKMGMDHECIIAGLLHDTVEDSTTTLEEISGIFGDKVSKLVDGVTKLTNLNLERKEKQAHAFRKLITYAADDIRVIFVKLLDRLHNMMTLDAMVPEKKSRISDETTRFYAPLAHRLGIYWLKEELESLSFYHSNPQAWHTIDDFIKKKYDEDPEKIINMLTEKVNQAVDINREKLTGKIKFIYGRTKSYCSIYKKSILKNESIESLYDILGLRVIIDSEDSNDCYLVMGAIHSFNEFSVLSSRFKDYISMPKENGYESIHTGIRYRKYFFEVQIRTEKMHIVAEEGNASHWTYKSGDTHNDKAVMWLKEVLKDITDSYTENAVGFMDDIETALPLETISVFTPAGELKTLVEGSTLVDFAYEIHGDLGDHCIGGTVNGKKVPLFYVLSNRDEVTIETSKKQFPRADWLKFVKTHKAKSKIRKFLKKQEKNLYIERGKEKLEKFFSALGRKDDLDKIEDMEVFKKLTDKYSLPKLNGSEIFYTKLATGEIKVRTVAFMIFSQEEIEKLSEIFPKTIALPKMKGSGNEKELRMPIYINGFGETEDFHVAKCCSPEEGDPIAVYVSQNRGYILHNKDCAYLKMLSEDRIYRDVYWYHYNMYRIEVNIELKNVRGALFEVVKEITELEFNINNLHLTPVETGDKKGALYIDFVGSDIKKVEKLESVLRTRKVITSFEITKITRL